MSTQPSGAEAIADERLRQIQQEGYTLEHDGHHRLETLLAAAKAYMTSARVGNAEGLVYWPWATGLFKPTTTRRDLVKAGALIAAAIDRLDAVDEDAP